MGGSSGTPSKTTSNTTSTPWEGLQPYLTAGLRSTAQGFGLGQNATGTISDDILGTPYPGNVVAPDSAQTTQALAMRDVIATDPNNISNTANNYNQSVLQGKYLDPSTNPYLASTVQAANKQITDSYNNNINPGIDSAANSAGRYGSGAYAALRNQSDASLVNSLGQTDAGIYSNAYNTERNNQQGALTLAGQTAQNNYINSDQLASTGDYYTNLAQQQLNANIQNYNTVQQQPLTALQTYMNLINGVADPISTSTAGTSSAPRTSSNRLAGAGGGALAGAEIGAQFGGWGAIPGAIIGGIGGYASSSDINLKENIVPKGKENGHNVYEFNYKGSPDKFIGVMAQEVQKTHPHAVSEHPEGLRVNYDAIGVNFRKVTDE